ncbi:MAG: XdhC family protein [Coriobacteriales bacterium]|nr:XdhC family protein [Coriobacteriales bacterium]
MAPTGETDGRATVTDAGALYSELLKVLRGGENAAVLSVYGVDASIQKSVISAADTTAWQQLEALIAQPQAKTYGPVTSILDDKGTFRLVEQYTSKPRLIILGGGHIALALGQAAQLMDFEIIVFDDRPSFANSSRFPWAQSVICDGFERLFERIEVRRTDYVVIVTRGHLHDTQCLEGLLARPEPAYTGMIGSKRRVAIVKEKLDEAGYSKERLDRIHSPIGLQISAVTPAEIAISILAEIIQVKRTEHSSSNIASCDIEVVEYLGEQGGDADALITIYESRGSVPIETGAKLSMTYTGTIAGTIGGGCAESDAMQIARRVINEGGWSTHAIDLNDDAEEDGMVCGGEMRVVIERTR